MHRIVSLGIVSTLVAGSHHAAHAGSLSTPVVGGTPVEPGAFPDVVAILGADGSMCSGTLIDVDLVLTAGHCIQIDPIEVIVDTVDLARSDGISRRVKWARAYPDWIDRYDVGVIMLENPVGTKARPIAQGCTTRSHFKRGLPLELIGFGLTTPAGTDDNKRLHRATVPLVDPSCTTDAACQPAIAPSGEFIAGGDGTDSCFGDSGGPVMIETARGAALIGVVSRATASWSLPCGAGGVYVRADKVVAWIENVSGRKLKRLPCDRPADENGDAAIEPGGCNAAGALGSGFVLYYAALVLACLRRSRRRSVSGRS